MIYISGIIENGVVFERMIGMFRASIEVVKHYYFRECDHYSLKQKVIGGFTVANA